jgi:hypothetical protein
MSMSPRHLAVRCVLLLPLAALGAQEPVDRDAVTFFRTQGLEHSKVMDHLSWICDVHGPRLTGSPNLRRAQQWAVETFTSWGLQNAHLESWGPFGRGWRCERARVEVVGDNPWPVIAYPKAWSPSLSGRVEAEVVDVSALHADALEAMDLSDKIVLVEAVRDVTEPFTGLGRRYEDGDLAGMAGAEPTERRPRPRPDATQPAGAPAGGAPAGASPATGSPTGEPRVPSADVAARANELPRGFQRRGEVMRILAQKRPLAIVDRGFKGDYGTVFVQGASASPRPGNERDRGGVRRADADVIPQFTFAVEHYNRISRILQKGLPVRIALELETTFGDPDAQEHNVLAEIPGSDLKDQVVMLGAHFDSWHSGTGATDNGCGSAVVMEASRLIAEYCKVTGQKPRRTIRAALWSGEEQGLLGSRAYVRQHFGARGEPTSEHALLSGYFNLDNGTGKVRGIYQQGNADVGPVFAAWLQPFHDLGATTVTISDTGGTDHQAFDGVGLPGFQFIQDPISYSTRTHHSNMDVWDHAVAADLQQASTIMAAFVWHTAQRDALLPREPQPGPEEPGERRGR